MHANPQTSLSDAEIGAFCDGELGEDEAGRIAFLLERDPSARARMTALMADRDRLLRATELEDAGAADPAITALADRLSGAVDSRRRRQGTLRMARAGLAACVAVAGGWLGHAMLTDTPAGPMSAVLAAADLGVDGAGGGDFVEDAVGAHAVFAFDSVHPVEFFAKDRSVMEDWFRDRLGAEARIPLLETVGFRLVGGRMLGDAQGALAHLLYENARGERVSLVYGPRQGGGQAELRRASIDGRQASWWSTGEFAWAVVEDSPGADVDIVATAINRELSRP